MRKSYVLLPLVVAASSIIPATAEEWADYRDCVESGTLPAVCDEKFDRIEWMATIPGCVSTKEVLKWADEAGQELSWKLLYYNEKCKQDAYEYYKRNE